MALSNDGFCLFEPMYRPWEPRFPGDCDIEWDEMYLFCKKANGSSVLVRMRGFRPWCYVPIDESFTELHATALINFLQYRACLRLYGSRDNPEFDSENIPPQLNIEFKFVCRKHILGWSPDPDDPSKTREWLFLKLKFSSKLAMDSIWNLDGKRLLELRNPERRWETLCKIPLEVYEGFNITLENKFHLWGDIQPFGWFRLQGENVQSVSDGSAISSCKEEYVIHSDAFCRAEDLDKIVPPFRVLVMDTEWFSQDGFSFPQADNFGDFLICIGSVWCDFQPGVKPKIHYECEAYADETSELYRPSTEEETHAAISAAMTPSDPNEPEEKVADETSPPHPHPIHGRRLNYPIEEIQKALASAKERNDNLQIKRLIALKRRAKAGAAIRCHKTELACIERWFNRLLELDPDVVLTYNGERFDWYYLYLRMIRLACTLDLPFLRVSRIREHFCRLTEKTFVSRGKGESISNKFPIPGRLNYDKFFWAKDNFRLPSYTLDSVLAQMGLKLKNDIKAKQIFAYTREGGSRWEDVLVYCIKDCKRTFQMSEKGQFIPRWLAMASVTWTPWVQLAGGGQQVKVWNLICRDAHRKGYVINMKRNVQKPDGVFRWQPRSDNCTDPRIRCKLTVNRKPRDSLKTWMPWIEWKGDWPGRKDISTKFWVPSQEYVHKTNEALIARNYVMVYTGAVVIQPKPGYYDRPIVTLDYASLYPSIMIARNLCLVGGTRVTYSGLYSRRIEDMQQYLDQLLSHQDINGEGGVVASRAVNWLDQGEKHTIRLTLSDGRTITCTPDHPILVRKSINSASTWVQANDILLDSDQVMATYDSPVDDPSSDSSCIDWKLDVGEFTFCLRGDERDRALAFARLLGYIHSDMFMTGTKSRCFASTCFGVNALLQDISIITKRKSDHLIPTVETLLNKRRGWVVNLPYNLSSALESLLIHRHHIPAFLMNPDCPLSVVREFLAGTFGGAATITELSGADSFTHIGLLRRSCKQDEKQLEHWREQIRTLLTRFDLHIAVENHQHTFCPSYIHCHCDSKIHVAFKLVIREPQDLIQLQRYIGVRYDFDKAYKSTVVASWIGTCAARLITPQPKLEDWLRDCGALEWFTANNSAVAHDAPAIPYFWLKVVSKENAGIQRVYDLTVERTHSFVANGVMVHNCYSTVLNDRNHAEMPQIADHVQKFPVVPENPHMFVDPKVQEGIIPGLLKDILAKRKAVRLEQENELDLGKYAVLDAQQLELKVTANSVYGFTGATLAGKMADSRIAESVTYDGRMGLNQTKAFVESQDWRQIVTSEMWKDFLYPKDPRNQWFCPIDWSVCPPVVADSDPKKMNKKQLEGLDKIRQAIYAVPMHLWNEGVWKGLEWLNDPANGYVWLVERYGPFTDDPSVLLEGGKARVLYGDSVIGDTPIPCKIGDRFFYARIGDLTLNDWKRESVRLPSGETIDKQYATPRPGLQVWTEKGWTVVRHVMRHYTDKRLFLTSTDRGCVVSTEDHGLLDHNADRITPREITGNTILLHSLPVPGVAGFMTPPQARLFGAFAENGQSVDDNWKLVLMVRQHQDVSMANQLMDDLRTLFPHVSFAMKRLVNKINIVLKHSRRTQQAEAQFHRDWTAQYNSFLRPLNLGSIYPEVTTLAPVLISSEECRREFSRAFFYALIGSTEVHDNQPCVTPRYSFCNYIAELDYIFRSVGYSVSYINPVLGASRSPLQQLLITTKQTAPSGLVTRNQHIELQRQYVYDLETDNHHFAAGLGEIIVHNTDSVMIEFPVVNNANGRRLTFLLGGYAAREITKTMIAPKKLEMEKIYYPYVLFKKKRYFGLKWMSPDDPSPSKDIKGLESVRRDYIALFRNLISKIVDTVLFQGYPQAFQVYKDFTTMVLDKKLQIDLLKFSKSIKSNYSNSTAVQVIVMDQEEEDGGVRKKAGDRAEYIVGDTGNPKDPMWKRVIAWSRAERCIESKTLPKGFRSLIDVTYYLDHYLRSAFITLFGVWLEGGKDHAERIFKQFAGQAALTFANQRTLVQCGLLRKRTSEDLADNGEAIIRSNLMQGLMRTVMTASAEEAPRKKKPRALNSATGTGAKGKKNSTATSGRTFAQSGIIPPRRRLPPADQPSIAKMFGK